MNASAAIMAATSAVAMFATLSYVKSRRTRARVKMLESKVVCKLEQRQAKRQAFQDWIRQNIDLVPDLAVQETIARMGASQIVDAMKQKQVSALSVMITMCLRAQRCGEVYQSNADEMFMRAIEAAKRADEKLALHGAENCGILHGLPISVKEHINLNGTDSTCGIRSRLLCPMQDDALVIEALVQEGAIPFVKSNVPLLLMLPEAVNKIYGRSGNPWMKGRTPGGSSGGEASLISSYCSFMGVGSDIGGSIRIPCHFTGTTGFKPTADRITLIGVSGPGKDRIGGQKTIRGVVGPMARCVDDCILMMKAWCSPNSPMYVRDKGLAPVYYTPVQKQGRRIGYYYDDGWFGGAKVNHRAVDAARIALEKEGHTLVPFTIPGGRTFVRLYFELMSADGNMRTIKADMGDEELLFEYGMYDQLSNVPHWCRSMMGSLFRACGEERRAFILEAAREQTVEKYWNTCTELASFRAMFAKAMLEAGIEALLSPGAALPALCHSSSRELGLAQSYTYLYNVLNYPAGTVPITIIEDNETGFISSSDISDRFSEAAVSDLKGSVGLPVGVQIACPPWKDELCLQLMKDLESAHNMVDVTTKRPYLTV